MNLRSEIFGVRTKFGVLIDPDHEHHSNFDILLDLLSKNLADLILVGGSTSKEDNIDRIVKKIRAKCSLPVVLFPGNQLQISPLANALFLPSLISGRNPEYLIGKHVKAASLISKSNLPVFPIGYILVGCGSHTSTASYVTQTMPISANDIHQIVETALAGQLLGLKCIYLEAGSGSDETISPKIITEVKRAINIPIIVGGGIQNTDHLEPLLACRPDMIVIGNILEKNPNMVNRFNEAFREVYKV